MREPATGNIVWSIQSVQTGTTAFSDQLESGVLQHWIWQSNQCMDETPSRDAIRNQHSRLVRQEEQPQGHQPERLQALAQNHQPANGTSCKSLHRHW